MPGSYGPANVERPVPGVTGACVVISRALFTELKPRLLSSAESEFTLRIHGGAPFQSEAFPTALDGALAEAGVVTHCGPYRRDEVPALMAEVDCGS
ncbi:Glycosyl transferase OS=Bosea thiooxidans OX=53254 GN=ARD30_00070 PE=3 SV=1 [Bosea thiooxidans]